MYPDDNIPEDIWNVTFVISPDGSADVEYDIIMSVPEEADRPHDHLNFGSNESGFEAFDSESNEPLRVDVMEKETGKLVIVIPHISLKRGDKYRYRLKLKQKGLLTPKKNDCYLLRWEWGGWPLKYNLRFILPENSVVYQTSSNHVASHIINNRPILVFEGKSKYDTEISIYANFFLGDTSAIELTEWRTRNTKESDTYDIYVDIRNEKDIQMIVNGSSPLPSKHNQWIDLPLRGTIDNPIQIIINDLDAKLKIFEKNSKKPLKAKILPIIFGGKGIQETLRIYFSDSQITSYFSDSQITLKKLNWVIESERNGDLGIIKKKNNVFRLQWIGSEQQFINYQVKCIFPPDVLLFYASPNLSESKIEDNRPILIFNEKSTYFTSLNVEALFIMGSKSLINFDTICSKCYCSDDFCKDITKKISSNECEKFMEGYK